MRAAANAIFISVLMPSPKSGPLRGQWRARPVVRQRTARRGAQYAPLLAHVEQLEVNIVRLVARPAFICIERKCQKTQRTQNQWLRI
jgi:hypothetical protein